MKRFFYLLLFCLLVGTTPAMAQLTDVITGLNFPYGLALDGNDLYISEPISSNRIIKIDVSVPTPPPIEVALSGLVDPNGLLLDGDELYFTDIGSDIIGKFNINDANPTVTTVVGGLDRPLGIYLDGDILYICDTGFDQLLRADLSQANPTTEVVLSGLLNPNNVIRFGDALYLSEFGSNGVGSSIKKIDITQNPVVVTTVTDDVFGAVGLTLNGSFLYVAESSRVIRIDLNAETPVVEEVATGLDGSRTVAFNGLDMYIGQVGGGSAGQGKISRLVISTPTFSELPNVCVDDMPGMLGGVSPTGGTYSGPGVTDNGDGNTFTFDPVVAGGVGDYTITYNLGGSVASSTLTVVSPPTVTFSTGDPSIQVDAGVQTGLSGGMPTGGVYSGNGVTDDGNGMTYSFDPAAAGEGENVITYTFSDANGCGGEQGAIITVTPAIPPGDNCDIAIDINSLFGQTPGETQTSEAYNNEAYNDDPSDPNENVCFGTYPSDYVGRSIWFSFTGDGSTYTINSTGGFDPFINLYTGECGALTEVACNDDTDGLNFSVEIETEAGVEYSIYIAQAQEVFATFNIEVTRAILPGDQCDIAIDINSLFGQAEMMPQLSEEYDNTGYSVSAEESFDPECGFAFTNSPIWFTFTGDGNRYNIASNNAAIPILGILLSGECENLSEIECIVNDEPDNNISYELQTEEGVVYSLTVYGRFPDAPTGTFNLEITNQGTVSVQNIRNTEFNVYPNPTNGWVQLDGFTADRIEVLDQLGRTVRTQTQAGNGVDMTGLPAGVYILRMQAGDEVISAKVVKE